MTTKASARTTHAATPKAIPSGRNGSDPAIPEPTPGRAARGRSTNGTQPTTRLPNPIRGASAASEVHLGALIDECDTDPALDHHDVALLVRARLQEIKNGWDIVQPALDAYVNTHRRPAVRRAEQRILRTFTPGDGTTPAGNPVRKLALAQLAEFAAEYINLGRGQRVQAGEITVEQWDAKIAHLREDLRKREETIGRYEAIVYTLRALNVDTIADAIAGGRHD